MNAEAALKLLFMGMTVMTEAMSTVTKINATIQKARDEGRDITDEELASLAADTDREHGLTMAALSKVINQEGA